VSARGASGGRRRTPAPFRAAFRLQLRAGIDFDAARGLVPGLARLGISHLYLSPVLQARRESDHGYDVVDPDRADPALGGEAALGRLVSNLHRHGLGLVLDVVPNHMAADPQSPAFADVLAHGPASRFAPWFDVDWGPPQAVADGRHAPLLLPWLGGPWREAAARGEIALVRRRGRVRLQHGKGDLPVDPAAVASLLRRARRAVRGAGARELRRLEATTARARRLPPRTPARRGERDRAVAAWEDELARLLARAAAVRAALDATLAETNAPRGAQHLGRLLAAQPYRLDFWRPASRRLNWRRFFDVDELIALRCEDPAVFDATHARVLAWVEAGWLDGLRIDHVDGLLDPGAYLRRLRAEVDARLPARAARGFGLWVEKIVARGEALPRGWPVDGTTGYEHACAVDALLVDPDGAAGLEADWHRRTGVRRGFAEEAAHGKRRAANAWLRADLERTTTLLLAELEGASARAPARGALRDAVRETVVHLEGYRPYLDARGRLEPASRAALERAVRAASAEGRADRRALALVFDRLQAGRARGRAPGEVPRLAERFGQLSGPVAAKGIEDTALYRYTPLLSRCDVGAEPDAPLAEAVAHFHGLCKARVRHAPRALLAGSTHDAKRSADTRARLDALSECPEAWAALLDRIEAGKRGLRTGGAPDRRGLHVLVQLLVGVWPVGPQPGLPGRRVLRALAERLETVAIKSAREARRRTSWRERDGAYEAGLASFVRGLLDPARSRRSLAEIDRFVRTELAGPGLWNALARVVLQGTSPGVPDLYQGDALPSFQLVDPDNRRPVDFAAHRKVIARLARGLEAAPGRRRRALARALGEPDGVHAKGTVWLAVLAARRAHPRTFAEGDHLPLEVEGRRPDHAVAFARQRGREAAVVVVARRGRIASGDPARPPVGEAVWGDTRARLPRGLAGRRWRSALTGETLEAGAALPLARALDPAPVALLLSDERR